MASSREPDPLAVTEREMLIDLRGQVGSLRAEMQSSFNAYEKLHLEQIETLRRDTATNTTDLDELGKQVREVAARPTVSPTQLWSIAVGAASIVSVIVGVTAKFLN